MPSEIERTGLISGIALLAVVVHIAHLTGLRNVLAAVLATYAAIALLRLRVRPPLAAPILGWLAVGVLSAAWSVDTESTLKSVLYEIVMPVGAFYAAWLAAQHRFGVPTLVHAARAGLVFLFAVTVVAHVAGQADMLRDHYPVGVAYYYPGPGPASTLALYAVPLSLFAFQDAPRVRGVAFVSLVCVPIIALGNENRVFWLALIATIGAWGLWQWKRFSHKQRRVASVALAAGLVVAMAAVSYLNAKRGEDRRLLIWQEWGAIARNAPFLGYGFGKEAVAQAALPTLSDTSIAAEDRNVLSHSHNLPLNIVLQVGLVGLAAFLILIGSLVRLAYRSRDPERLTASAALVALVVAMLTKNMTDDLMDRAVILAFWTYAGALVGRLTHNN